MRRPRFQLWSRVVREEDAADVCELMRETDDDGLALFLWTNTNALGLMSVLREWDPLTGRWTAAVWKGGARPTPTRRHPSMADQIHISGGRASGRDLVRSQYGPNTRFTESLDDLSSPFDMAVPGGEDPSGQRPEVTAQLQTAKRLLYLTCCALGALPAQTPILLALPDAPVVMPAETLGQAIFDFLGPDAFGEGVPPGE